ncbi:MAG: hypothetical protein HYU36_02880 [Planctomycetes bacterium]|nr:hypothetical protein [Planctomycetota bacterium]
MTHCHPHSNGTIGISRNRRLNALVLTLGLLPFLPSGLFALEPWEEDRLFWLDMNWTGAAYQQDRVTTFDAVTRGQTRGKPLSAGTAAVKDSTGFINYMKCLPTGGTDQAVEWPAAGSVDPSQGALSFFVQGRNWVASSAGRETLVVLDGKSGALSVEKHRPGTLGVVLNGTALVETPLADPDRLHHLVVNFETDRKKKSCRVSLVVDRRPAGTKEGVALPASYDRIIVGQRGPGPGTNKNLDNVALYRRPLAQGEINKIYYLEGKIALPKLATVPRASKPPAIDGIFDAGEWDQAAGLCGFVDETAGDSYVLWIGTGKLWDAEDTVRLAYDDGHLYFAYHCPPPEKIRGNAPIIAAMLKNTKTGFDTDVDADDVLFIDVHRPYPFGDMYHLIVNGINTHYEFSDGGTAPGSKEKGRDLQFNPAWTTASTLTLDGWKLEGAIPFRDLKMDAPRPEEILHVNFMRMWRTVLSGNMSWAHGTRHGPKDDLYYVPAGVLRFGGHNDVCVQLQGIGRLDQGRLDLAARLLNPGEKPARVRAEVASNSGEVQNVQEIDVPARGMAPYAFQAPVTAPETGEIILRVTDLATQELIFASGHPVLRPDRPSLYLRKYPSWDLVKIEANFDSLAQTPAREVAAELEVIPIDGGKRIASAKASGFSGYNHTFVVSTKNAPRGKYEARIQFARKGRRLDDANLPFELKPLPAWYDNTIGHDDPARPPYPFSPMELRGDSEVVVWGRCYRWGESLLPVQIEINPDHYHPMMPFPGGRGLLRSPMRLAGQLSQPDVSFSTDQLKAAFEWTEKTPIRIAGKRKVTAGNLALTADLLIEYDGYCWVKLTLDPVQGQVEVRSLVLEQLFTPESSDVVNLGEYSLVGTGKFPVKPFVKSAVLPVWVGNGDGGLQTFLETMASWHVNDLQTTLQLLPGRSGGTMRYNLVDKPLVLTRPRVIEFGFNATPVRLKEWRTFREQTRGHRTSYFAWFTTGDWLVGDPGWGNTSYNGPMISARYDYGSWERAQPYLCTDAIPVNDPDVLEFGDEWLINPEDRWREQIGNAGTMINVTYHSKSYRDWVMWRMNELFKRAPFAGVYYDVVQARSSANPYAGAGIVREDGTRVATPALRGLRDLFKRLYVLCRHTYPDGQTMVHSSGMPNMAYMGFSEVFFDGENLNSSINAQRPTYRGILTPDVFRAEYMGHNFGPQLWWLGQNRIGKETAQKYGPDVLVDHMAGLMLLHDTPVILAGGFGPWHCNDAARRDFEAIRRYELYGCGYRFVPYWRQDMVSGLRENQYASFYIRQPVPMSPWHWGLWTREETDETLPHRAVGIFCNESDSRGEVSVQVNLEKLGFKPGMKVVASNAVHSTGYRVEHLGTPEEKGVFYPKPEEAAALTLGGELRFPMTEWNYRMIVLEEAR